MHNIIINIITLLLLATIVSCTGSGDKQAEKTPQKTMLLEKAHWLIGEWHNVTPEGIATESWTKQNDTVYAGKSLFIVGKDTVSSESLRLEQLGQEVAYVPTVKDQNKGLPVRFVMKTMSDTQMIFENPQHDFPQTISYTKINADSLVAEISGKEHGQERKQAFPMKRVQ